MPTWVTLAGGQACGADGCPAIHLSDEGRLFVRGRRASDDVRNVLAPVDGEDLVEIPQELLAQACEALRQMHGKH